MRITKKLMKRVLFQADQDFNRGPGDICTVRELRNCELADYEKLLAALIKDDLIRESGEPGFYFVTHRGEMVGTGQDCGCKECKPKDYV